MAARGRFDLLGFGDTSADALKRVFMSLCTIDVPEDGLTFLAESVQVEPIREDQEYGGMRVKLMATLRNVRIPLQVDIGAGDAVVPPPEVLLHLPRAQLRAYRPETSIAEKTPITQARPQRLQTSCNLLKTPALPFPVGPFLCLATMISATPLSSGSSGL